MNLVFDIHGVLLGRTEPPGHLPAGAVLATLRDLGHRIRFVTNGSSVPRAAMAGALEDAGIAAEPSDVFTTATTVCTYLKANALSRVFVIGSDVLRKEVEHVAELCGPEEAEVVVVSRDPNLDHAALDAVREDVHLLATCRDARFADGDRLVPGPGPTVERVEQALGMTALVLGKPNPYVLTAVMGLSPRDIAETVVIGDSVDQDVQLARNAGARSLLLTGTTSPDSTSPGSIKALDEMLEVL